MHVGSDDREGALFSSVNQKQFRIPGKVISMDDGLVSADYEDVPGRLS